jgi:hypothetical protein
MRNCAASLRPESGMIPLEINESPIPGKKPGRDIILQPSEYFSGVTRCHVSHTPHVACIHQPAPLIFIKFHFIPSTTG